MLFIKRKIGEAFRINSDVQITIINIQGTTVTIGATYPEGNEIWREEVFQRIEKEKQSIHIEKNVDEAAENDKDILVEKKIIAS